MAGHPVALVMQSKGGSDKWNVLPKSLAMDVHERTRPIAPIGDDGRRRRRHVRATSTGRWTVGPIVIPGGEMLDRHTPECLPFRV